MKYWDKENLVMGVFIFIVSTFMLPILIILWKFAIKL